LVPLTRRRREQLQPHPGTEPDAAASRSRDGRRAMILMGSHYQNHEHLKPSSRSKRQRIMMQQKEDDEFAAGSSFRKRRRKANTLNSHTADDEKKRTPATGTRSYLSSFSCLRHHWGSRNSGRDFLGRESEKGDGNANKSHGDLAVRTAVERAAGKELLLQREQERREDA
jgi:hypothetical protein